MIDDEEFDRLAAAGMLPEIPSGSAPVRQEPSGEATQMDRADDRSSGQELRPVLEAIREMNDTLDRIDGTLTAVSNLLSRVLEA